MRINFTDNFDGYCQKCHDMLQEQTMEIDHTTTDKKREIGQMKGSTNLKIYQKIFKPPRISSMPTYNRYLRKGIGKKN